MMPVIHRDARAERRESIKVALVILAVCLMILAALWPDKPRKDPYTAIPETGIKYFKPAAEPDFVVEH